ncbi:MAG TPA: VOC family protein [Candidatus Baltobacteraceae bacterium]|nr:VOC family protein [Candidatus Baltobacteraceae bacterium]
MTFDHIDVRVGNLPAARRFYDALCNAIGLTKAAVSGDWVLYGCEDSTGPFIGVTSDSEFLPNRCRIAIRAKTRDDVDRIAKALAEVGAGEYEAPRLCPEYASDYYASFFCDPDGNRWEVCHRSTVM